MKDYETRQRKLINFFLKQHLDQQFTVNELAEKIDGISISALYRNLNKMFAEGLVQRFQLGKSRKLFYQYIGHQACLEHLHLKCQQCGRIVHMDSDVVETILSNTIKINNFYIDVNKTIILGNCGECA